jgi:hypothetical protein
MKAFKHFEPYRITDWLIIPWFALRYAWYWLLWRVYIARFGKEYRRGYSRHTDPMPVWCERCMWTGPVSQLWHGYGEWEAESECPRCGLSM